MKFIMLINVKMPTIVGILTLISMINTTSESLKSLFFCILISLAVDILFYFLFDLILYVPSTIFQLYRDESSLVEPVLS